MNIVVLDGHTLNPGDLSWEDLKALGSCEIFDRTPPGEVAARAANAEIAITNKAILHRVQIEALPKLKYIGVTATGYNVVDVEAAKERGIIVTNVPTYGTRSVAQHTFALLLELTQHVGHHAQTVRDGRWVRSPDWCYWDKPLIELDGLTMGVVGYGRIGQATARLAQALCGVMRQFFAVSNGLSADGGSVERTSSAAAAMRSEFNASASAASSTKGPRLVLIRNAVGFICARRWAFTRCFVSGISGQCRLTTSRSA